MRYDFADVQDEQIYSSIPEGAYTVEVAEVRPGLARDGSARWSLRLDVTEGDFAGRVACFDNLTWSDRGVLRVKLVLGTLGFDVSGTLELEPDELLGRRARIQVVRETWEDAAGVHQTRNTVPYRGWFALGEGPDEASDGAVHAGEASSSDLAPGESPF